MVQPLGILRTEVEQANIEAGQPTYRPGMSPEGVPKGYPTSLGGVDVVAEAQADVAAQTGGGEKKELVELERQFDALMALRNDPELSQEKIDTYLGTNLPGVTEIGEVPITPEMLRSSTDSNFEETYFTNFITENAVPKTNKLPLAFSGPDYKEVRLPPAFDVVDPMFKDLMTTAVQDSQDVARIVTNVFEEGSIPRKGQEAILRGFATGNFYKELIRAMKELPGDTMRGLPDFGGMIYSAGRAIWDQMNGNAPEGEDLTDTFNRAYRGYSLTEPRQMYEKWLNDKAVFESAYIKFNAEYKRLFYEQFDSEEEAEDAWFVAHTDWFLNNPKLEEVVGEDGTITVKHMRDENGELQYNDYMLPRDSVRQLLDLAFNKLPATEKGIIFFSTMAPVTGTFTAAGLHKGGRYIKMVEKGRTRRVKNEDGEDVPAYDPSMSDFEIFKAERRRGMFGFENRLLGLVNTGFSKTWNLATLQFLSGGAKGVMTRRRTLDMHVETLNRYDRDIETTQDELVEINAGIKNGLDASGNKLSPDDIAALRIQKTAAEQQIVALQNGLKRYKLRVGSSRRFYGDNPFMRQVALDDAIIAGAIGYGSALLSGSFEIESLDVKTSSMMDPGAAEALTSVVMPLVAPYGGRKLAGGVKWTADLVTSGGVTSAVETMDVIGSYIHLFPEGTLLTGTDAEIRDVIRASGMEPKDETVRGIFTLRKILNAMDPVYRERAYQGLIRYNRTMGNLRAEMKRLNLDDETADKHMQTLSLSLAQATGLAPLIAIQQSTLKGGLKVRDLTDSNKLNTALDNMAAQQDVLNGMELNLELFIDGIEKDAGISIVDNQPLSDAVNSVTGMIKVQRNSIAEQKMVMKQGLDELYKFASGEGRIDEDTVTRLLDINKGLVDEGTLIDNIWEARMITEIRGKLMAGLEEQADAIINFHTSMTSREIEVELNRIAEDAYDIVTGERRALASAGYRELDNFKGPDGQPVLIDINDIGNRLRTLVSEFADKPISYAFRGGKRFMSQGGMEMQRTLNKVALRGFMNAGMTRQEVTQLLKARRQKLAEDNPDFISTDYTLADMALDMQDEVVRKIKAGELPKDAPVPSFLKATVHEAEKIARYFRNQARRNANSDFEAAQSFRAIEQQVNRVFAKTPGLLEAVEEARSTYRTIMGEPTSAGTYADNVENNKTYNAATTSQPGGTRAKYKRTSAEGGKTPDYIFRDMQKVMARITGKRVSNAEFDEGMRELRGLKDRMLEFYGANLGEAGYGFDLSDPKQAQVVSLLQKAMTIAGDTAFSGKLRIEMEARARRQSPFVLSKAEAASLIDAGDLPYDFSFAQRIQEIENEFKIPVTSSGGAKGRLRLLNAGETRSFAQDFDIRLQEDADAVRAFNNVRDELMDAEGGLQIAAQRELDIEKDILRKVQSLGDIANDPIKFGREFFESSNPEKFEADVEDFVLKSKATGNPMSEDEVRSFMKYMYTRYIMEQAGLRYKYTPRTGAERKGVAEVQDVRVLIDHVANPAKREMMSAVLGEDAARHMEDIADWATFATGDALSIRNMDSRQLMTLESAFARAFNIARGMVSIPYVATEVTARLALYRNESLIKMALSDRQVSGIMAKMLRRPEEITKEDIKTLGIRMRSYLAKELILTGGELPTVDQIVASLSGGYEPSDEGRVLPETPSDTIVIETPKIEREAILERAQERQQ